MRLFAVLLFWLLLNHSAHAALDDYYHNYTEIRVELSQLAAANSDIMRVDTLGWSNQLQMPILAAILSDNVQEVEDEPAVLLVGTPHAEELLGTEVVMNLVQEIISHRFLMPYVAWLAATQLIVVPTVNPEGMGVVLTEQDITYRKNLTEIDGNCVIHPGIGNDSCGVDLNRNYDVFWNHGDTLWYDQDPEAFDYYRGPAPFSEGELQALRDLTERYNVVYSIHYHAARTSNNFQHVIFPWGWKHPQNEELIKPSPDLDVIRSIGEGIAAHIPKLEGGFYDPVVGSGRKGSAPNWFYSTLGTMVFLIEVGTNEAGGAFQPQNEEIINQICQDNLGGIIWMMNRLVGVDPGIDAPMLTGLITDAQTGAPLKARVEIAEHTARSLRPRWSQMPFGRYYRVLNGGYVTLRVRKPGYVPVEETVLVNQQQPTIHHVALEPLPRYTVSGRLFRTSDAATVAGTLQWVDEINDTTYTFAVPGEYSCRLPRGTYRLRAGNDNSVLVERSFTVEEDVEYNVSLPDLQETLVIPLTDPGQWTAGGENSAWSVVTDDSSGWHLVESPTIFSLPDMETYYSLNTPLDLSAVLYASLHLEQMVDTEADFDFGALELSSDGEEWTELFRVQGHHWFYSRDSWNLDQWCGGPLYLRLHFHTDGWVEDEGWHLRSLTLRTSAVADAVPGCDLPEDFRLLGNFPNPFNPATTVIFTVPAAMLPVVPNLEVFNLQGRRVALVAGDPVSRGGIARITWFAGDVPSGLYFYRVRLDSRFSETAKMLLVK